ncbi:hypothetical protein SAMN05444358_106145 [Ruegeria halocynthiae]|uniref:Uncharacterized protein n=1 Tax=Ruegeria halocynthiae TaxID=985054 RepID=A0A1H3C4V2_9RHOB|nr:hypothetical protein [Ruegeria halocynthiae]SDX49202.1 hypothetical protein SAMN05444358_106145 [Ruegeria halocynthiae]
MIWKSNTHEFTATVCQRTGAPCPALAQMARALTQAISTAGRVTTSGFQVEGSSELSHCPEGCVARFRAQSNQIRVFCGTDPEIAADLLDDYANMMFGTEPVSLPSSVLATPPCAMLEASVLTQHSDVRLSPQACI